MQPCMKGCVDTSSPGVIRPTTVDPASFRNHPARARCFVVLQDGMDGDTVLEMLWQMLHKWASDSESCGSEL